jgi:hypothetical protein
MSTILQFLGDSVRESFGNPARLRRLLGDRPDFKAQLLAPEDNIDMGRVPRWHHLSSASAERRRSDRIELMGWRMQGHHMSSFIQYDSALDNLVRRTTVDAWSCDLQDVHGFAHSKSDLERFRSTDEMVKTNSPEMIGDVSIDGLRKNLAHDEIRLLRERPTDWLQVHQWDKRMFVVNDGGSHHLAAAKYIAGRIGAPVPLRAPLHYYSIDPNALALLRGQYDTYLVSDKPELANAFFDAMQSFGATWLWHDMPQPYEEVRAIFLPRDEQASMRVSQVLREAGFVDLGQHLEAVARSGMPEVLQRRLHEQNQAEQDDESEAESEAPRAY